MIKIAALNVKFRKFALIDINLNIESGEYFILVGPTGSGKTVLLETIAGLNPVDSGRIYIDESDITTLPPEKRNIGMVYQDAALFPHITVGANIAFGMEVKGTPSADVKKATNEMAELLGIAHLLDRKPGKLSGGEKQKVALARALAIKPPLLLLDEPLSALDAGARESLQQELKRLQHELGVTVIHVTHDFEEAMVLGKHIGVIGEGKIWQTGTPEAVFRKPESEFVAHFTLMRNIFPGESYQDSTGNMFFRSGNISLRTAARQNEMKFACISPDDIILSPANTISEATNQFCGVISRMENRGMLTYATVELPPALCCAVTHHMIQEMNLTVGRQIKIIIPPEAVHVF